MIHGSLSLDNEIPHKQREVPIGRESGAVRPGIRSGAAADAQLTLSTATQIVGSSTTPLTKTAFGC